MNSASVELCIEGVVLTISSCTACVSPGMEKLIRVYDLDKVDSPDMYPAQEVGIRGLQWLLDDTTLLCTYSDKPGIG